ncbi:MAG: helix-turn-helix domain-containing protein [Haloarculaceae archaeon]
MSSEPTAASWNGSSAETDRRLFTDPTEVFDAVQDTLGRKWHLRIVYQLLDKGPMGFSALKSEVAGVSSKMLSESLTRLEDDGLVDREIVSDQPVRVEYSLTERGRALQPVVSAVVDWGAEYASAEAE